MESLDITTTVKITLKVEVPAKRVEEVSQAIVDLLAELDVFNGTLEQGAVEVSLD